MKKERKTVEPMRREQDGHPYYPIFSKYQPRAPLIKPNNLYQMLNKDTANYWHSIQTADKWRRLHKKQAEAKAEAKAEAERQEEIKKNDEARMVSEALATELADLLVGSDIDTKL